MPARACFVGRLGCVVFAVAAGLPAFATRADAQQQTVSDVLSFLLVNRSVSTGDFTRDEQAAQDAANAISGFLRTEIGTLPINSPAGGFSYRLDPSLGANVRSSDSFGPFFTERTLTAGKHQFGMAVSYTQASFDNIDGRKLRDGTLVSTASQLEGDAQPIDVETVTLRLETRTTTFSAHIGLTDRLDLSAAVPFVSLTMSGSRLDTYRGTAFPQASGSASASGLGDAIVRAKFNPIRRGASGLAFAADIRLPTGDADNLLGTGRTAVTPRVIVSLEREHVAWHGEVGYTAGGASNALDYGSALTVVAGRRLTLVAEVIGRRLDSGGQLIDTIEPRPGLVGVDTIRLTATSSSTSRVSLVAGVRWNIASRWLWSFNTIQPITAAGLNAHWVPTMTFDYSIGR